MIKKIIKLIVPLKIRLFIRRTLKRISSLLYSGDSVYCICCNQSFSQFLDFGNPKRGQAQCPSCGALERTRLLNYYLANETDIFNRDKSILHFAPEYMLSKKLRKATDKYISVDIEKGYAEKVEDIQNLTFADKSFDYVICSCVLAHVEDEAKAIDEIYRVLKINGKALIITLINLEKNQTLEDRQALTEEERRKLYGEKELLRLHGTDFIDRLKRKNGNVEMIDYALNFNEAERHKFRLGNKQRELIFLINKIK